VGRWLAALEHIDVLLMDEPTQGIDVGARRDLYELIRRLAGDKGKSILFTSSDPEETCSLADRVSCCGVAGSCRACNRSLERAEDPAIAHGAESIPEAPFCHRSNQRTT
jgi:ABC-type sugar transport system ATPase subunit